MLEAETVIQAAKNVRPKSDETNERRWVKRRTLWMDILDLERVRYGACSKKKQYRPNIYPYLSFLAFFP